MVKFKVYDSENNKKKLYLGKDLKKAFKVLIDHDRCEYSKKTFPYKLCGEITCGNDRIKMEALVHYEIAYSGFEKGYYDYAFFSTRTLEAIVIQKENNKNEN